MSTLTDEDLEMCLADMESFSISRDQLIGLILEVKRYRAFGKMHHDRLSHLGPGPDEISGLDKTSHR